MRDRPTRGTGGWGRVAEMQGLGAVPQPPMSAAPACLDGASPAALQEVHAPVPIFPEAPTAQLECHAPLICLDTRMHEQHSVHAIRATLEEYRFWQTYQEGKCP